VGPRHSTTALFGAAVALHTGERPHQALAAYRKIIRLEPRHVDAHLNLGILQTQLGKLEEAEATLRRALTLATGSPAVRQSLALALMGQGQYQEGWAFYEARDEIPALASPLAAGFPFPRWRGEDLAGKRIAILPEHGFGDQIQFARFIPRLQALGAEVTLLTRQPLVSLFAESFPGVSVIAAVGSVEFPDPDVWTIFGALVGELGVTLESLPSEPYLKTPARWPPLPPGFKIGLQTKGNPKLKNDLHRSLSPQVADRLRASLPGQVISLDPADSGAQDFAETAALIQQLDLVVSVDTSVAHLAGSLGRPGFVLLPAFGTDWRWLRDRQDSPWYPSLRLYRRDKLDVDWMPTIERVVRDAQAMASGR